MGATEKWKRLKGIIGPRPPMASRTVVTFDDSEPVTGLEGYSQGAARWIARGRKGDNPSSRDSRYRAFQGRGRWMDDTLHPIPTPEQQLAVLRTKDYYKPPATKKETEKPVGTESSRARMDRIERENYEAGIRRF